MPKDRNNKISCSHYSCDIELTLEVIGGKWKALLLWELHLKSVIRFNEFRRLIPEITQKMLSQQLKDLESNQIVQKKIYAQIPPMVEYRLTELGEELIPILDSMDKWGKNYVKIYENINN